ncbi:MAG: mercury methylation ferredoxin HgcB [Planctomycetota bacterium]|jgi:NAD-dependent dihydropyrimidine dehydrogenase PreA subunit
MAGLRYLSNVATLTLDHQRCNGCGMCAVVCPHRVFRVDDGKAQITDRDACMECGACARNCPSEAVSVRAGVGCVTAVIQGALTGTEPNCDCSGDSSCCG